MEIQDIRVLKGPNYWSIRHKVIAIRLNIGKFENLPSNKIPGFFDRIAAAMPGLNDHHCSEGRTGGFFERLKTGTWMGHIVEHIALELQNMAGMKVNYGKTRSTGETGVYNLAISYEIERAGIYAGEAAVRIAEALAAGRDYAIEKEIKRLREIYFKDSPGPSTQAIINAAVERDIPFIRLDNATLVQLGYGAKSRRIDATISENTSNIAVDLAGDKFRTKILLRSSGIPVPEGEIVHTVQEASQVIESIGFPVVIKPLNSNQGKGVAVNINEMNEALSCFEEALKYSDSVLVERYHTGNDYRLLVIDCKLIAVALRTPAMVTGNGQDTVMQLIEKANRHPDRGIDHENVLTRIKIDHSTESLLRAQSVTLDSIPARGRNIILKYTANLSQGGTSEDVTDQVHPEIRMLSERTARQTGLDICGIDLIAEDISQPADIGKPVVIEVNAAPGFRMHTHPWTGKSRNVGKPVIDMLFPGKENGRIPIIAITGTNGKTTTSRLIAHIARTAGYITGCTTTDGIYINGNLVEKGDCTGFNSAMTVLKDRSVNFAILETARGGMLRSGLAFDKCDVGIVTNVAEDHIGLKDINSIEEMAKVKSIVPESVKPDGLAILNENNEYTYAMIENVSCPVALFSINPKSRRIQDHMRKGGLTAVYSGNRIIISEGTRVLFEENVINIPLSFNGKAIFNIENAMASLLAVLYYNVPVDIIKKALRSFEPNYENTPGRLNMISFRNFSLIIDYAHNPHGISALGTLVKQTQAREKVGIITAPGDRRNSDIINVGKISAELFDKIIIRIDEDTRGRKPREIIDLLHAGIRERKRNMFIEIIPREHDALSYALSNATEGTLIVLMAEDISRCHKIAEDFKSKHDDFVPDFVPENRYVLRVGKNNVYEYTKRKVNTYRRP
ncbi:MAG TPA: cyanophycin synthetase [Bacteroidales bacterium]|nr:cyanophycin synthetase [Bacteroidales bacterium]